MNAGRYYWHTQFINASKPSFDGQDRRIANDTNNWYLGSDKI